MAVYESFYGLRTSPFTISPDPDFLFLSPTHREALAGLIYAICDRKGFGLLAGEVGTGKTTLAHTLLMQLGERVRTAFIFNPRLSREDLYQDLLSEFRLPAQPTIRAAVRALEEFLLEQFRARVPVVLILDEAHALSAEILEEVRLLSNFETPSAKLLQIILVGQPELLGLIDKPHLRQLRQRLAVRLELRSLSLSESIGYLQTRVKRAGGREEIFTASAYLALYEYSRGLPRALNTLADNTLLIGMARDRELVDASLVRVAADQLGVERSIRVGLWERLRYRRIEATDGAQMATMTDFVERLMEPSR